MTWGENTWFVSGFEFYMDGLCLTRASLQLKYVMRLEKTKGVSWKNRIASGGPEMKRGKGASQER